MEDATRRSFSHSRQTKNQNEYFYEVSGYKTYLYDPLFPYESGWDKYALKYASLLEPGTLYYLHKEVMYNYLEQQVLPALAGRQLRVLDVNCGTGNDFPFWLGKGANITGIDGSAGMLNKAAATYREGINDGRVSLYQGRLEELEKDSLGLREFDIIYSITGGFSYIDDSVFSDKIGVLKDMLAPDGVMVTAHLNNFCLPESLAFLFRGKFSRSMVRLKKIISLGNGETMYLRGHRSLVRLFKPYFPEVETRPLIAVAPPYQTDLRFSPSLLHQFRRLETACTGHNFGRSWADQIIVTCRNKENERT